MSLLYRPKPKITVLAGGVGAARFLQGLVQLVDPSGITVIVNTGDDTKLHGLYISPDIDTIIYTLSGLSDEARGWGIKDDTFHCLAALKRLGHETWFNLGDQDMAMHIHRTELLRRSHTLSQVTAQAAQALGLQSLVLPMSNHRVETRIITNRTELGFQEYLVKHAASDRVDGIKFAGVEKATPAPEVVESIRRSEAIIVAPSNPLISIGPILAVKGIRDALRQTNAAIAAVSPIVGGRAIKGPAAQMMADLKLEVSAYQVADLYKDFLDIFIMDSLDAHCAQRVEALGIKVLTTDTVMDGLPKKVALARLALCALNQEAACP